MRILVLILILISVSTLSAHGGKYKTVVIDEKKIENARSSQSPTETYAQSIKKLLNQDLKSADVHLSGEGSLKWLFVAVGYQEWKGLSRENRRELVELLLRHMKQNFPTSGLKVSVGINADQPLAEGEWGRLAEGPTVKMIGE